MPAQHYFMGGIWVDRNSRTSMAHLYAIGETSCNGVHGSNRLASNSLLESLVFAERSADQIRQDYVPLERPGILPDMEEYKDGTVLQEQYHKAVLEAIERERKRRENE